MSPLKDFRPSKFLYFVKKLASFYGIFSVIFVPLLTGVLAVYPLQEARAATVSCPVTDGGAGDGDSTVNGTIQISASTTWTMPSGASGDFWDCTGKNILVTNSAVLTLAGDTASGAYPYIKTDNLQIDALASISGDAKGCPGVVSGNGKGPDTSTNICAVSTSGYGLGVNGATGGGYGGIGGDGTGSSTQSTTYGSITDPLLFGSSGGGGASTSTSGAGGGVVRLTVTGTFTFNGTVSANGGNGGLRRGGGSGGSVNIVAGSISGTTGSITANGGNGGGVYSGDYGGGGGGGRILVSYTTSTLSFTSSNVTANGGTATGSGTAGTDGSGYVVDSTNSTGTIFERFYMLNTSYAFSQAITFDSASNTICMTSAVTPSYSAPSMTLGGTITCTSSGLTSLSISATTGGVNMASGTTIDVNVASAILDIDVADGSSSTWTGVTITGGGKGNFTIDDPASLSIAATSTITANVSWTTLTSLTIASGVTLSADSKGCTGAASGSYDGFAPDASNVCTQGGTGSGNGTSNSSSGAGGGGHGGAGGNGTTSGLTGGGTYDSETIPVLYGASGGASFTKAGSSGGGKIRIDVTGALVHEGSITANGAVGTAGGSSGAAGAGAGGAVYITAGTFDGDTGTFSASGGAGYDGTADSGGGGGGRVTVIYSTNASSFLAGLTAASVAAGGVGPGAATDGAAGTLYVASLVTIPNTPSITAPANAATDVSRNPTLTTSAYSGGATHLSTDWQVATDSGFSDVVWSSIGDTDDLASIVVNTTKGTFAGTLSGQSKLNPNTYYVRARHANSAGNSSYATTTSFTTANTAPTVASLTPVQKTNDSSIVDVSFVADDANDDDQVKVKVELDVGAGYIDPTLSTVNADTTATYGDPAVDNAATYQIGTSSAWVTTSSGANTVNFDLAASNFTGLNTTATVRLTPNDQGVDGTPVTQTFTVDDVNPTAPGTFASSGVTSSQAGFSWTASTETNFNHYELWYGTVQADVQNRTGTASEWDNDNDANLATRTTTTTTVTGLSQSTTYYTLICAVDNFGNETCTSTISFLTLSVPAASSVTAVQASNNSDNVNISFVMADGDGSLSQAKIEYSLDGGSTWADPTISTVNADSTSTYNDPTINNADTYQVQNLVTASGNNTINIVWQAATDIAANTNISNARIRVTPYDGTVGTAVSSANFILDLVDPTEPGSFAVNSTTSASVTFSWTASTETNFNHYELWYGTVQADVQNRTGTALEWDNDPNDANLAVRTTTSTTITSLVQATTYYAIICAVDNYGNETCKATAVSGTTGTPPVISSVSASQKTNGSKVVDVQFTIDDVNDDNTLQVKVELNTGSGWVDPTIDTTNANTTATYGDPGVNNSDTYQIGIAGAYITSSSGANVVHFDLVAANFTDIDSDSVQIRLTPTDGGGAGSVVTSSSFSVDAVSPVAPTNFAKSSSTGTAVTLTWTAGSDARFNHYELWYGTTQSDVQGKTGTALEWDNDPNDENLASAATTTTVINGLTAGATYYVLICAVDNFGNSTCTADINFIANALPVVSSVSLTTPTNGSGEVTVSFNLRDMDTNNMNVLIEYNLNDGGGWRKATLSTNPGRTTVTAGGSPTVDNSAPYQITGVSGNSGNTNGVSLVWLSTTDAPGADLSNVQIRITPADAYETGSVQTPAAITVDNLAPTGLANFQMSSHNSSSITWTWTKATEAHFSRYSVWYGTTLNDVNNRTGTATRWDEGNDANLSNINTVTTTITGLSENTTYYAKIWATDTYGNDSFRGDRQ